MTGRPSPAQPIPDQSYIPVLDGLRALSILLVIISHLGLPVVPGGLGVTVFFFVSGLLITRQLLGELGRTGRIGLRRFALRRLLRLYPALLVMIVLGGGAFIACGGTIRAEQLLAALFYWANYALIAGVYNTHTPFHPYAILWSLAVEEHFYLLFPLAMLALRRRPGLFQIALMLMLVGVALWRLEVVMHCAAPAACHAGLVDRIDYATDTRLDAILFGALLSAGLAGSRQLAVLRLLRRPAVPVLGLGLLLLSLLVRNTEFREIWRFSVQGVAMLALIGWLVFAPDAGWARRLLAAPALTWIGRLSYSLYLWHWATLACLGALQPGRMAALSTGKMPAALVAAVVLGGAMTACASYYGVERPMLRLRRRWGSHA